MEVPVLVALFVALVEPVVEAAQGDAEGLEAALGQGDLRLQAAAFGGLAPQGLERGLQLMAHRDNLPTGFEELIG